MRKGYLDIEILGCRKFKETLSFANSLFLSLFSAHHFNNYKEQYAFVLFRFGKKESMKKGISKIAGSVLFLFLQQIALAQTTDPEQTHKNLLGIRISSKDAVINQSITYKRFLQPDLAVEGLFSFGDPAALGILVEKHKAFGPSGLTWFVGGGIYTGFGGGRRLGAQGVVGLDLLPTTFPLNFSIDWKPELNFTKQFSFEPAAVGFSARFIF